MQKLDGRDGCSVVTRRDGLCYGWHHQGQEGTVWYTSDHLLRRAVAGTCDPSNLVTSGYKQLCQPLAVNRLPCAQECSGLNIVPAVRASHSGLIRQGCYCHVARRSV